MPDVSRMAKAVVLVVVLYAIVMASSYLWGVTTESYRLERDAHDRNVDNAIRFNEDVDRRNLALEEQGEDFRYEYKDVPSTGAFVLGFMAGAMPIVFIFVLFAFLAMASVYMLFDALFPKFYSIMYPVRDRAEQGWMTGIHVVNTLDAHDPDLMWRILPPVSKAAIHIGILITTLKAWYEGNEDVWAFRAEAIEKVREEHRAPTKTIDVPDRGSKDPGATKTIEVADHPPHVLRMVERHNEAQLRGGDIRLVAWLRTFKAQEWEDVVISYMPKVGDGKCAYIPHTLMLKKHPIFQNRFGFLCERLVRVMDLDVQVALDPSRGDDDFPEYDSEMADTLVRERFFPEAIASVQKAGASMVREAVTANPRLSAQRHVADKEIGDLYPSEAREWE